MVNHPGLWSRGQQFESAQDYILSSILHKFDLLHRFMHAFYTRSFHSKCEKVYNMNRLCESMAQKRKKKELEEEYVWVPPEFDEKAFLEKDILSTKLMAISAVFAIVFGIVSAGIGIALGNNAYGFIGWIVGAILITRSNKIIKLEKEDMGKMGMVGNVLLYALLALGVWILLINAPFTS